MYRSVYVKYAEQLVVQILSLLSPEAPPTFLYTYLHWHSLLTVIELHNSVYHIDRQLLRGANVEVPA